MNGSCPFLSDLKQGPLITFPTLRKYHEYLWMTYIHDLLLMSLLLPYLHFTGNFLLELLLGVIIVVIVFNISKAKYSIKISLPVGSDIVLLRDVVDLCKKLVKKFI